MMLSGGVEMDQWHDRFIALHVFHKSRYWTCPPSLLDQKFPLKDQNHIYYCSKAVKVVTIPKMVNSDSMN